MSVLGRRGALIPFESASGALMIAIVAAMAFIACFAMAAALGTSRVAQGWTEGLAGAATVRVEAGATDSARRNNLVLEILRTTDGVLEARPLSEADVAELLEPWFGVAPDLSELPAPGIIAVTLDPEREPDPAIIQARFDGAAVGAIYDDHGRWRSRAALAAESVRSVAIGALLLASLAIAAVVFLVVRIAMRAHRETIAALRMAGAEDGFVAGLYQWRFFWLGLMGGVLGVALAFAAIRGVDAFARVSAALPALTPPPYWPLGLVGVVLVTAIVSVLSARVAAMTALRARA